MFLLPVRAGWPEREVVISSADLYNFQFSKIAKTVSEEILSLPEHEKGPEHIAEKTSLPTPLVHGRNRGLQVWTSLLIFGLTDNVI